jgi:hypothetical protein
MKTQNLANLPPTQHAVQLVGPDKLVFNKCKEVFALGKHQILCWVEAVGLCFSPLLVSGGHPHCHPDRSAAKWMEPATEVSITFIASTAKQSPSLIINTFAFRS